MAVKVTKAVVGQDRGTGRWEVAEMMGRACMAVGMVEVGLVRVRDQDQEGTVRRGTRMPGLAAQEDRARMDRLQSISPCFRPARTRKVSERRMRSRLHWRLSVRARCRMSWRA